MGKDRDLPQTSITGTRAIPFDWVCTIRECFSQDRVLYSGHARREMLAEEFGVVTDQEVGEAVESAELLEEYPDDRPYPSCLLFGHTRLGRPLHLVAAYDEWEGQAILVTVYQPDPRKWEGYRRRRK